MDVHPDNFMGLVASKGTDQVVIIDTHYDSSSWNTVLGTVKNLPVGSKPTAVAFTHKGDKALVLNSNGTLSLVDTSGGIDTWAVTRTINVGKDPKAVAFAEYDWHAYVTNSGDGTVSVIDLRAGDNFFTVVPPRSDAPPMPLYGTVKVGDSPQDVFINLGERVAAYVVNMGSNTISIIDDQPDNPTFNTVIHTVPLGAGKSPIGIILTEP
jgi:YVTN family beta-propeller protein